MRRKYQFVDFPSKFSGFLNLHSLNASGLIFPSAPQSSVSYFGSSFVTEVPGFMKWIGIVIGPTIQELTSTLTFLNSQSKLHATVWARLFLSGAQ